MQGFGCSPLTEQGPESGFVERPGGTDAFENDGVGKGGMRHLDVVGGGLVVERVEKAVFPEHVLADAGDVDDVGDGRHGRHDYKGYQRRLVVNGPTYRDRPVIEDVSVQWSFCFKHTLDGFVLDDAPPSQGRRNGLVRTFGDEVDVTSLADIV